MYNHFCFLFTLQICSPFLTSFEWFKLLFFLSFFPFLTYISFTYWLFLYISLFLTHLSYIDLSFHRLPNVSIVPICIKSRKYELCKSICPIMNLLFMYGLHTIYWKKVGNAIIFTLKSCTELKKKNLEDKICLLYLPLSCSSFIPENSRFYLVLSFIMFLSVSLLYNKSINYFILARCERNL